jgi:cell division transport system permease protein
MSLARTPLMRRRLDLPLRQDGSFLAWIIAVIVFIAALALAVGLVLAAAIERWDRGLAGTLTAQAPPGAPVEPMLTLLRGTPGIVAAEPLGKARSAKLLEPWLGSAAARDDLPLPLLIDIRTDPDATIDLAQLRRRLAEAVPGATVDDHGSWLAPLLATARLVEAAALIVLGVIAAAAVLVVVFATRTGLAVHHDTIELLHLMGARGAYIARQFERQALLLAMRGGVAGLLLAALVVGATLWGAGRASWSGLLGPLLGDLRIWGGFAALPLAIALAAAATARITVLRRLARLP